MPHMNPYVLFSLCNYNELGLKLSGFKKAHENIIKGIHITHALHGNITYIWFTYIINITYW